MISEVSWDSRRWDHVAATLRDETQGEGHVKQAEVYARCFSPEDDSPKDIMAAAAAHGETDVFQDGAPPLYRLDPSGSSFVHSMDVEGVHDRRDRPLSAQR